MEDPTTPQAQTPAVEDTSQTTQPVAEPTTSEPVPETTEPAPAGEAQAEVPKVSNEEKRKERTRKAFSELLTEKRAVEQKLQEATASPAPSTPQTEAVTAPAIPTEPTLEPNSDGEITAKEISAYSKAMSEYAAQRAVAPLQAENAKLLQKLEQTQGNVQQMSVAEIQKQDAAGAKDLVSKYDILNKDKTESYDADIEQDMLTNFNVARAANPALSLKDYGEAWMGMLEEYAQRISAKQNTEQDKLAAEAPVVSEGATTPPDIKSLHWKDMEKKIGFA